MPPQPGYPPQPGHPPQQGQYQQPPPQGAPPQGAPQGQAAPAGGGAVSPLEDKLKKLKAAFEADLITEDEYKSKRAALLADF